MPRRGMLYRRAPLSRYQMARPAMGCCSREVTRGGLSSRAVAVAETAISEAVPNPCGPCGTAAQRMQDFAAEVFRVRQTATRLDSKANRLRRGPPPPVCKIVAALASHFERSSGPRSHDCCNCRSSFQAGRFVWKNRQ
jgi:hypothetical protein